MPRIFGYVPARLGSERVKAKNLRLLGNRPLIAHAIDTLLAVRLVERFVVNTESPLIASVARENGMECYLRDPALAQPTTMTDDIVIDFLRHSSCDAVVVVNPTAPFLTAATVDTAVEQFLRDRPTALFSTSSLRRHAFLNGHAVNFDSTGKSPRTQDLSPLSIVNFIICIFDAAHALGCFEETGSFLYKGRLSFMEMDEQESFDIDTEADFQLAERMIAVRQESRSDPAYHPILERNSVPTGNTADSNRE